MYLRSLLFLLVLTTSAPACADDQFDVLFILNYLRAVDAAFEDDANLV